MNKWTPGEWSVPGKGYYRDLVQIPLRGIDCERIGFQIGFVSGHKEEEALANARLISAAPELYEALERLLKWVDPIAGDNRNDAAAKEEMESVSVARAALAKAQGEA